MTLRTFLKNVTFRYKVLLEIRLRYVLQSDPPKQAKKE